MDLQKSVAEISLSALSHNLRIASAKAAQTDLMAVVKADAYGHGAVTISDHLLRNGVRMLGVAFVKEALDLRESGIAAPIQIFFDTDNIDLCVEHRITPTIFDYNTAKRFSAAALKKNLRIPVHIKIDTGMGRVGLDIRNALQTIIRIARLEGLRIEGLMSHFPDADLKDKDFSLQQLKEFMQLVSLLGQNRITVRYLHMANSAALLTMPESHLNMVRPGIMLYGYGPTEDHRLKPVLSLKSRILFLKKVPAGTPISYGRTFVTKRRTRIAVIPLGYADGYSRKLSNQGEVLVGGMRAQVIGRVCMDTIMVDVTRIPDVRTGSEVVIIGRQGKDRITALDIADKTGTIPYEVLTSVGSRVRKVYT